MPNICQFCGQSKLLVKSHIIPEGLYWGLNQSIASSDIIEDGKHLKSQGEKHKSPVVLSIYEGEYPTRRQNGIWDRFLCEEHEKQFNAWDAYAVDVLRDRQPQYVDNYWQYRDLDYAKLKLFFMSLLWRANVTENNFFDKVQLGTHADQIKQLIGSQTAGSIDDYSVLLWRSEELIAKAIIPPYRERCEGMSFIRFYLPGYMALIKVDQRPLSNTYRPFALFESGDWIVSKKDYFRDGEKQIMLHVARENKENNNG